MADEKEDLPLSIKVPTKETLLKMLVEEEKIRLSKEYQDECTKVKDIPNGWLDVTSKMQYDLVKKFGFDDEMSCDIACNRLRRAQYLYPDDDRFKTTSLYIRNNKARQGEYKVGDEVPDMVLHNLKNEEIKLHELFKNDKLNIILAASTT